MFNLLTRVFTPSGKSVDDELMRGDGQRMTFSSQSAPKRTPQTITSNGLPPGSPDPQPALLPLDVPPLTEGGPAELAAAEMLLRHLVEQHNVATRELGPGPRTSSLPYSEQVRAKSDYVARLMAMEDLCGSRGTDLVTLREVLRGPRTEGLIETQRQVVERLKTEFAIDTREAANGPKQRAALKALAAAVVKLCAAYEAAVPFFPPPFGPTLKNVPTDTLRAVYNRAKHCKTPEDLL